VEDSRNVLVGAKALTGLAGSWGRAPYKEKIVKMVNEKESKGMYLEIERRVKVLIIFMKGTLLHIMIALMFSEMVKTSLNYLFSRKFVRPQ